MARIIIRKPGDKSPKQDPVLPSIKVALKYQKILWFICIPFLASIILNILLLIKLMNSGG